MLHCTRPYQQIKYFIHTYTCVKFIYIANFYSHKQWRSCSKNICPPEICGPLVIKWWTSDQHEKSTYLPKMCAKSKVSYQTEVSTQIRRWILKCRSRVGRWFLRIVAGHKPIADIQNKMYLISGKTKSDIWENKI